MATFTFKITDYITTGDSITKRSDMNIEIPSTVENNILSYTRVQFVNISNQTGLNIQNDITTTKTLNNPIKLNSNNLDNLQLFTENIPNKNIKKYTLK
jgi:hypothetical protein